MGKKFFNLMFLVLLCSTMHAQPAPSFQMLPNPAHNKANIHLNKLKVENVQVQIFSIFGTPVSGIYQQIIPGENRIQLYFPDVQEGIYLIRIRSKEFDQTQRLKIQR